MSVHLTQLSDGTSGSLIEAELDDDVPIDGLFEAEELWAPERVRFLRDCLKGGVKLDELPQSIHWNWSLKAARIPGLVGGALSPNRLFGIKAQGAWQGMLIATCVNHVTRLPPGGMDLVYVDFVEAAPWNWKNVKAGRTQRFRGVGRQLIEVAVRWSLDLDFKGRLGLHALPQADDFYRNACGMTDFGADPAYRPPLRYFELSDSQAKAFLGEA
jgi:hypothetical protein